MRKRIVSGVKYERLGTTERISCSGTTERISCSLIILDVTKSIRIRNDISIIGKDIIIKRGETVKVQTKYRTELMAIVRAVYDQTQSREAVKNAIEKRFRVEYDPTSVRYWIQQSYPEIWSDKIKEQNKYMEKCKEEVTEKKNTKEDEENYAERLFKLFHQEISMEEF